MNEELISLRDLAFQLYEMLDAEGLTTRPRHAEIGRAHV